MLREFSDRQPDPPNPGRKVILYTAIGVFLGFLAINIWNGITAGRWNF